MKRYLADYLLQIVWNSYNICAASPLQHYYQLNNRGNDVITVNGNYMLFCFESEPHRAVTFYLPAAKSNENLVTKE